MAKTDLAVAEVIWNLIAGKTGNVTRTDFFPQKPAFDGYTLAQEAREEPLERAVPESQGIDSARLADFLTELAEKKSTDIHQVLVVRNGWVICECAYAPYRRGMWHASYSLCKSVTGMAIGMLAAEGRLKVTDRVVDFFGRKRLRNLLRMKEVTVEHLLTMTSCVNFKETGIIAGNDWVRGFLEAGFDGTPGKDFAYNSMNSYMLSAIVTELTGETMMDYLRPRLWEPLGICRVFWETCPMGITKGGWGLFLRPEDAAKLGMLYLQKGRWKNVQLVDEEWVETSCRPYEQAPDEMSTHGYGYQLWMGSREGSFNYNGMLGQNVVAYPDLNMAVVTNAGSRDLFQNCELMEIVKKYFETDFHPPARLPENASGYRRLCRTVEKLEGKCTSIPSIRGGGWMVKSAGKRRRSGRGLEESGQRERETGRCFSGEEWLQKTWIPSLDGKVYELDEKHVGLMPLLMQVFHNNYTDGIRAVGFSVRGKRLFLRLFEEEEKILEAGFGRAAETAVSFHGELYRLAVLAQCGEDEDGRPVLKLDIAFLEEACRRKLKLYFGKGQDGQDCLEAAWDETPGKDVILEGLETFQDKGSRGFLMNAVRERGGMEVFQILVEHTVRPVCRGRLMDWRENSGGPDEKKGEAEALSGTEEKKA